MRGRRTRLDSPCTTRLIDIERVALDPLLGGFSGVIVELLWSGDSFVVQQSAEVTGNRLLRFTTRSEELARTIFEERARC